VKIATGDCMDADYVHIDVYAAQMVTLKMAKNVRFLH